MIPSFCNADFFNNVSIGKYVNKELALIWNLIGRSPLVEHPAAQIISSCNIVVD